MYGTNNATIENNGNIYLQEKKDYAMGIYAENGTKAQNNGNIYVGNNGGGMLGIEGATVINGENGVIDLNGEGESFYYSDLASGIWAEKAVAINNGIIRGSTKENGLIGIETCNYEENEETKVINNGIIDLSGTGDQTGYAKGIDAWISKGSLKIENNNTIKLTGSLLYSIGTDISASGNSALDFTNKGIIEVQGRENEEDLSWDTELEGMFVGANGNATVNIVNEKGAKILVGGYAQICEGIEAVNNSKNKMSIRNSGEIRIENGGTGISAFSYSNKGEIDILNDESGLISSAGTGISISTGGSIINNGKIETSKTAIDVELTNENSKLDVIKLDVINNNTINVSSGTAINIFNWENTIVNVINDVNAKIKNSSSEYYSYGIEIDSGTKENTTVINNGIIELKNGTGIVSYSSNDGIVSIINGKTGFIKATRIGISGGKNTNILNEGTIKISAVDFKTESRGIYNYYRGDAINAGRIELDTYSYIAEEDGEEVIKFIDVIGMEANTGVGLAAGTGISKGITKNDTTGEIILGYGQGMVATNSKIINDGAIVTDISKVPDYDKELEVDTDYDSIGMVGREGSEVINDENGKIILKGITDDSGTYGMQMENSNAKNAGIIKITDVCFGDGILAEGTTEIENIGTIVIRERKSEWN
jgi:hypothetical protein